MKPQWLTAQSQSAILIVPLGGKLDLPPESLIKTIRIKRKLFNKTLKRLTKQAIDSTYFYNGNCLQLTYFNDEKRRDIGNKESPDYLRANIFRLNSEQQQQVKKSITQAAEAAILARKERRLALRERVTSKNFELILGGQFLTFNLKNNPNWIQESILGVEGKLDFCFYFNRIFKSKKYPPLSYRIGIGAAWEQLVFSPLVTVEALGLDNLPAVRVAEVWNREYQLLLPLSVAFDLPNIISTGYGLRLLVGLENSLRVHRVSTQSKLVTNYSFRSNVGIVYEDENLSQEVSRLYADFITPYTLQASFGIELLPPSLGSGGIKYINMIVPAFGRKQQIDRQFGLLFYLNIPL